MLRTFLQRIPLCHLQSSVADRLLNRFVAGSQNSSGVSVLCASRGFANESADPAKEIHDILGAKPSDAGASGGPQPENVAPTTQMHLDVTTGKAGEEEGDSVARRGGNVPFGAGAEPRSTDSPEELMARADAAIKEQFQPEGDGKVQEGGEALAQTADMQAEEDKNIGKQQREAPTAEQVDA